MGFCEYTLILTLFLLCVTLIVASIPKNRENFEGFFTDLSTTLYTDSSTRSLEDVNIPFIKEPFKVQKDFKNKDNAARLLHVLDKSAKKLISHLEKNFPEREETRNLSKRYNTSYLFEASPLNPENLTSYTVNKTLLGMCLRPIDNVETFHNNFNLVMFVLIHEMAHMAVTEHKGHGEPFIKAFVFLLDESTKIGIYKPEDYSKNPQVYCGLDITRNPQFTRPRDDYYA